MTDWQKQEAEKEESKIPSWKDQSKQRLSLEVIQGDQLGQAPEKKELSSGSLKYFSQGDKPTPDPKKYLVKKIILIAMVVALGLGLVAGAIFVYPLIKGKEEETPTTFIAPVSQENLESELASQLLTSTPTPEPDRTELKIQILNGSGVPGLAGEAKEFLEETGYQEVAVGNADSYDYQQTEISIKDSQKNYLELLKKDLEDEYSLSEKVETLEEESKYDAVVTLGKK